jgi:hypothetical protein
MEEVFGVYLISTGRWQIGAQHFVAKVLSVGNIEYLSVFASRKTWASAQASDNFLQGQRYL